MKQAPEPEKLAVKVQAVMGLLSLGGIFLPLNTPDRRVARRQALKSQDG